MNAALAYGCIMLVVTNYITVSTYICTDKLFNAIDAICSYSHRWFMLSRHCVASCALFILGDGNKICVVW